MAHSRGKYVAMDGLVEPKGYGWVVRRKPIALYLSLEYQHLGKAFRMAKMTRSHAHKLAWVLLNAGLLKKSVRGRKAVYEYTSSGWELCELLKRLVEAMQ